MNVRALAHRFAARKFFHTRAFQLDPTRLPRNIAVAPHPEFSARPA